MKITFKYERPKDMTRCDTCGRKWTLLFGYEGGVWSCWRKKCRQRAQREEGWRQ